jgi:hypothetical protein
MQSKRETEMTNGKITLKKLNLMGFTPENQVYIVQNGGGVGSVPTFHFLKLIGKWLDHTTDGLALVAPRIAKFKEYAESNGFEVVMV